MEPHKKNYISKGIWIVLAVAGGIFVSAVLMRGGTIAFAFLKKEAHIVRPYVAEIGSTLTDSVRGYVRGIIGTKVNITAQAQEALSPANNPDESFKVGLGNISDGAFVPPATGKMIRVNLETMQMYLYENGEKIDTLTLVGKGKTG